MKILVISPGALYPVQGMSQVRIINQISRLSREHEITLAEVVVSDKNSALCRKNLGNCLSSYEAVRYQKFRLPRVLRIFRFALLKAAWLLSFYSMEELSNWVAGIPGKLAKVIGRAKVEAVLIHYWYLGCLFSRLEKRIFRIIDTHYLVEENLELLDRYKISSLLRIRMKHELRHSLAMQQKYFGLADLVIVNSTRQKQIMDADYPLVSCILAVNGQELEHYLNYEIGREDNSILFYGALHNQFNRLGLQTLLQDIMPELRRRIPELKLYVVGSNPPEDMINKYDSDNVIFTGFVNDIRPVVGKCSLLLLPLQTSSGFRGRAVEVMALGVPVIGTNNALQSLGITDGVEGFIRDDTKEMIERTLEVLKNHKLQQSMSDACRRFAAEHFSVDAAFGELSRALLKTGSDNEE